MSDSEMGRRALLSGAMLATAAAVIAESSGAAVIGGGTASATLAGRTLRFLDLTHALTTAFNWMPARPRIAMDPIIGSGLAVGMNLNRLMLVEHTGTHIDVPRHFASDGKSVGEIPLSDLIVPLVMIDLRARSKVDPDAGLTPDDILAWEKAHGPLPKGGCIAINSGYDPLARMQEVAKGSGRGSPGFSPEACKFLIAQREVKGIAVDAMSIDQGTNGPAYPVHQEWLRSGRWGIEGLTNLDAVPASGALLIVGAAPIAEATGVPIRAIAMFAGS
ncbi:cyclase family protein [Sphingomonas sp. AP4-R1]|uniref:cyclase family protein n=1 Tax=Sphingomonas sp. AP4-R1 TaxID=2735134 RepID=UPI001493D4D0|nr:cyclase family protein [Sphingomonas sp. AP4-R1]QJU58362.1 cyclase family protein [Sphingomonas sp. AP4-R1]